MHTTRPIKLDHRASIKRSESLGLCLKIVMGEMLVFFRFGVARSARLSNVKGSKIYLKKIGFSSLVI